MSCPLAARTQPELHPLLQQRHGERLELVVVTADKGLCGGFNTGIIRAGTDYVGEHSGAKLMISAVGKKARDFFRHHGYTLRAEWTEIFRDLRYSLAEEIAAEMIQRYVDNEVDKICLVFNEFKSAIQARPIVQQLLPIEPAAIEPEGAGDYIYEPDPQTLFNALLPHYVENQIFHALLESSAAEHAARMTAMDAATKNAGELIESLTLTMNRVRQSAITTEIIEVVSGAEALG